MNTAKYVDQYIADLKAQGKPLVEVAWQIALACIGWAYVFGARGQECTPANRRSRYNGTSAGKDKDNIKNKCKNFEGTGTCSGCQWYPNGRTRFFDCRGFTYWVLYVVYGWKLEGAGCTSQWNKESNWKKKGLVAEGIPENTLVCLFYKDKSNPNVMAHTGFGYNGETVECSAGVQHSKTVNKKWTHWGVPACEDGDIPTPVPPTPTKPTLKKGSSGSYVTLAQTMLIQRGYSCGSYGADGKFGNATEKAVKEFQKDNGLKVDGIIGSSTWAALESAEPTKHYTVTIPGLTLSVAEGLKAQYPNATVKEE